MSLEGTVYEDTEFDFESEIEENRVTMIPTYKGRDGSQNFTEGLMETMGFDYTTKNLDDGTGMYRSADEIEAAVKENGEVVFSREKEGDLLELIEEFREILQ